MALFLMEQTSFSSKGITVNSQIIWVIMLPSTLYCSKPQLQTGLNQTISDIADLDKLYLEHTSRMSTVFA